MKTSNQFIVHVVFLLFLSLLVSCTTQVYSKAETETTIILIRHAQKSIITRQLTERGHQNARALVNAIGDMNITAIYSPSKKRNIQTATPLAEHLGVEITVVPRDEIPNNTMAKAASLVKKILDKHSGETVLWVGNTSNLGQIYWTLGGAGDGPVNYGDLFILTVPDEGKVKVEKRSWGVN